MNSQQMMEEIDRLARLCEAKDAEISRILELNKGYIENWLDVEILHKELSEAKAQIAMQAEVLRELHRLSDNKIPDYAEYRAFNDVMNALSATSETVAAWRAKETDELSAAKAKLDVLAEVCTNAGCESLDDLKDMLNAAKETEPLRREVAYLVDKMKLLSLYVAANGDDWVKREATEALSHPKATALAYEREVKANAIEDTLAKKNAGWCDGDIRAINKGEVK